MSHPTAPEVTARPSTTASRLRGIDVARCLALLGMVVAHVGTANNLQVDRADDDWMWIADGRSSALFATLAGCSLALMARGLTRSDAAGWASLRARIATRSVLLWLLGTALIMLETPIAIILPAYAWLFLIAIPVLRLPTPALLGLAALAFTGGSALVLGLRHEITGGVGASSQVEQLVLGYYPVLAWLGYLFAGLVMGRVLLAAYRADRLVAGAGALLVTGVGLALLGYGAGTALGGAAWPTTWPEVLTSIEPHADAPPEMIGNLGVAFTVIALCLLLTSVRAIGLVLAPLAAAGAMPLTLYTAQILVIAVMGPETVYRPLSHGPLIGLSLGLVLAGWLWSLLLGRGPLERLLRAVSTAAGRAFERTGR